jgi:2-phospho-L-lactate guanylyltransferase
MAHEMGAYVIPEPFVNGLNNAANLAASWAWENGFHSLFIIPADIPVLVKTEIDELLNTSIEYDVVIAESKNGGTNALLLSLPNRLTFCYGENSAKAHAKSAKKNALQCYRCCPTHLSQDIDIMSDLTALNYHLMQMDQGFNSS